MEPINNKENMHDSHTLFWIIDNDTDINFYLQKKC